MKRMMKWISAVMALVLVLSAVTVAAAAKEEPHPEHDAYEEVLKEYEELIAGKNAQFGYAYAALQEHPLLYGGIILDGEFTPGVQFRYAFHDLDGNGVDELFVWPQDETNPDGRYMYACDGSNVVKLLGEDEYQGGEYWINYLVMEDGTIVGSLSDGKFTVVSVRKLGPDGCSLVDVEDDRFPLEKPMKDKYDVRMTADWQQYTVEEQPVPAVLKRNTPEKKAYEKVLKQYEEAFADPKKAETDSMIQELAALHQQNPGSAFRYAYPDINGDGTSELVVSVVYSGVTDEGYSYWGEHGSFLYGFDAKRKEAVPILEESLNGYRILDNGLFMRQGNSEGVVPDAFFRLDSTGCGLEPIPEFDWMLGLPLSDGQVHSLFMNIRNFAWMPWPGIPDAE